MQMNSEEFPRFTTEMKDWLYDLSCGRLDAQACLQGLFKHYLNFGMTRDNVLQDIHFHTSYGQDGLIQAKKSLDALYSGIALGTYKLEI